jgi:hypothetical protein
VYGGVEKLVRGWVISDVGVCWSVPVVLSGALEEGWDGGCGTNGKVMQRVGKNVEISVQWVGGCVWVEKAEK